MCLPVALNLAVKDAPCLRGLNTIFTRQKARSLLLLRGHRGRPASRENAFDPDRETESRPCRRPPARGRRVNVCEADFPAVTEPKSKVPADEGDHRNGGDERAAPLTTPRTKNSASTPATTIPRPSRALTRTRDMRSL